MDGSEVATAERRRPLLAAIVVDPAPKNLRKSLEHVDALLERVDPGMRRRARLLLSEVISRSSIPARSGVSIRIEVDVLPHAVRMQVAGAGLVMPSEAAGNRRFAPRPSYPYWVLDGLADRWGHDRRGSDFGLWFLLETRHE
jgi:hypothetical protein